VVGLPTCQRAFGLDFLAGGLLGELAEAAFLLFDFDAILAGIVATDFLGAAFVFAVAFFAVDFLVAAFVFAVAFFAVDFLVAAFVFAVAFFAVAFLGAAFVFAVAFFAVAFLVAGVLAFALVGAFAAERPGLTLAAPGDRLRVLPRTVSVPGPGIRLVSSPDSHRTCSMLPLVDKTTPSLGPDLDATDTLSPTSATPSPHLAEGPSIGRAGGVHKPGARP